jgi:hypothetical protein
LYIDFPGVEEETRIIALKVPELDEKFQRQIARFVSGLRKLDIKKAPSIAETLDWARALVALGMKELDSPMVKRTRISCSSMKRHPQAGTSRFAAGVHKSFAFQVSSLFCLSMFQVPNSVPVLSTQSFFPLLPLILPLLPFPPAP